MSATVNDMLGREEGSAPYLQEMLQKLMQTVKSVSALPTEKNFEYYSTFEEFSTQVANLSERTVALIDKIHHKLTPGERTSLNDVDDEFEKFELVIDHVDLALERVDSSIDELRGMKNEKLPPGSQSSSSTASTKAYNHHRPNAAHPQIIAKPQLQFRNAPDNSELTPFVPVLTHKPHALTPLPNYSAQLAALQKQHSSSSSSDAFLEASTSTKSSSSSASSPSSPSKPDLRSHLSSMGLPNSPELQPISSSVAASSSSALAKYSFPHPYAAEIQALNFNSPQFLDRVKEQIFRPLAEVPFTFVETVEEFRAILPSLRASSEIAIDLEHHDMHSYLGFTCLMQLSTRTHDFVIDTLELREELHELLEIFADPKVVKVLHGADMDVQWLQRDFGLYLVNMFDTGKASRVLEMPSFGLRYLLNHYCGVDVDKKYQLADWRLRPLPYDMLLYARQDTHYLLYIYDRMRNELVEKSRLLMSKMSAASLYDPPRLLVETLNRSRQIALTVYEKPRVNESSHIELCKASGWLLNETQMRVLKALYKWRDSIARREDESVRSVMPNRALQALCTHLPVDEQQVSACVSPIPPLLRKHMRDMLAQIQSARMQHVIPVGAQPLLQMSKSSHDEMAQDDFKLGASSSSNLSVSSSAATLPVFITERFSVDLNQLELMPAERRRMFESFDAHGFVHAVNFASTQIAPSSKSSSSSSAASSMFAALKLSDASSVHSDTQRADLKGEIEKSLTSSSLHALALARSAAALAAFEQAKAAKAAKKAEHKSAATSSSSFSSSSPTSLSSSDGHLSDSIRAAAIAVVDVHEYVSAPEVSHSSTLATSYPESDVLTKKNRNATQSQLKENSGSDSDDNTSESEEETANKAKKPKTLNNTLGVKPISLPAPVTVAAFDYSKAAAEAAWQKDEGPVKADMSGGRERDKKIRKPNDGLRQSGNRSGSYSSKGR